MHQDLTDPQLTLQAAARELAEAEFRPRAAEVDATEEYPWASVGLLADAGFMGMTILPVCRLLVCTNVVPLRGCRAGAAHVFR